MYIHTVVWCSAVVLCIVAARKGLCDFFKERHDIVSGLGGCFEEHDVVVLLCALLAFFCRHFALVIQVSLVAHERNDDFVAALSTHVFDPPRCRLERVAIRDVVHDNRNGRVTDIRRYQGAEPFLSSRVPQLQTHRAVIQIHGLRQKVDADRSLVVPVECVVHEARDQRGLSHRLLPQKHELELAHRAAIVAASASRRHVVERHPPNSAVDTVSKGPRGSLASTQGPWDGGQHRLPPLI